MFKSVFFLLSILFLSGCGGEGSSSEAQNNNPDTTVPTIILNGEKEVSIEAFTPYIELGATATSSTGISLDVKISGNVNIEITGNYLLTYEAKDPQGNISQTQRVVTVTEQSDEHNKSVIDVLVLYSDGVDTLYHDDTQTRISHLFALSNQINASSRAGLYFNIVHIQKYAIDDTADSGTVLDDITFNDTNISTLRETVHADEVIIYRPYMNDGLCGLAWGNNDVEKQYAIAHVSIDCAAYTTSHEIGHNMGLDHSHRQNGIGRHPYSLGHGVDNAFATIMSYGFLFNAETSLVYSNPNLTCFGGEACGIEAGEVGEADAVKTILETKGIIAGFN